MSNKFPKIIHTNHPEDYERKIVSTILDDGSIVLGIDTVLKENGVEKQIMKELYIPNKDEVIKTIKETNKSVVIVTDSEYNFISEVPGKDVYTIRTSNVKDTWEIFNNINSLKPELVILNFKEEL